MLCCLFARSKAVNEIRVTWRKEVSKNFSSTCVAYIYINIRERASPCFILWDELTTSKWLFSLCSKYFFHLLQNKILICRSLLGAIYERTPVLVYSLFLYSLCWLQIQDILPFYYFLAAFMYGILKYWFVYIF